MSNDSISRVYQFLAKQGNWVSEADANGDGVIIKTEFRNFMEENFEWDGTPSDSEKNDLINTFWNTIDTNQGGKISGTNLRNKNALDSKEIDNMSNRIEMYEILNTYTSSITVPSVVSDITGWKKSVSEGLGAIVEQYIKDGGKAENLESYLAEKSPAVEQKTTADYCANEYLKNEMADFIKEYEYSYADDSSLQSIIDSYVQNIPADESFDDIKDTVISIIDSYLATAGLKDEKNCIDLSKFGYVVNDNSMLNDLQKSIVKKKLESALEDVKNREDYEANASLYDTTISNYINEILSNSRMGDFEEIQDYGIEEFESSESFETLVKTISVQNVFKSEEFTSKLSSEIGESFAERFANIMPGEIEAYDNMINEAISKAQNGDFDNANEELDNEKLITWIINETKSNLSEFYPNGLGDVPIEELNLTYDTLVESAKEQQDAAKIKEAAIKYCNALSEKSTALANAVKDVFGNDYESKINALISGEVDDKISELKEKALEIGDVSTFTISSWSELPNEISLGAGMTKNYQLSATVMNGDSAISNDRISYCVSVKSGSGIAALNGNTLTVTGGSSGYTTVEVSILVDGIEMDETKTIKIKTVNTSFDWSKMDTKYNGYIAMNGERNTENDVKTLGELYNGNGVINLMPSVNFLKGSDWKSAVSMAKTNLANFVNGTLVPAMKATGNYDEAALNASASKLINLYNAAFDHSLNNWAGKKSDRDNLVSFEGENYSYRVSKFWSNDSTLNTDYAHNCSASSNELGLRIGEQYDDNWFQIVVNARCVMDLFNKFYSQSLVA